MKNLSIQLCIFDLPFSAPGPMRLRRRHTPPPPSIPSPHALRLFLCSLSNNAAYATRQRGNADQLQHQDGSISIRRLKNTPHSSQITNSIRYTRKSDANYFSTAGATKRPRSDRGMSIVAPYRFAQHDDQISHGRMPMLGRIKIKNVCGAYGARAHALRFRLRQAPWRHSSAIRCGAAATRWRKYD